MGIINAMLEDLWFVFIRFVFVLFSICICISTLAAVGGAGYVIYKIITSPWFQKLCLVFAVFVLVLYFRRKT